MLNIVFMILIIEDINVIGAIILIIIIIQRLRLFHFYSHIFFSFYFSETFSCLIFFVLGFYDTRDHDRHHSHFDMNYGFPFPYLDILHGTYHGNFLNFDIQPFGKNK